MKKLLFFVTALILSQPAYSFYSVFDTADTAEGGKFKFGAEAQYILNRMAGAQFIGHFNYGLDRGRELQFLLGSGTVNLELGAFYKYIPIPDIKGQPAMGATIGFVYANKDGAYTFTAILRPMLSKKFQIDEKSFINPFIALPIGVSMGNTTSNLPIQLAFGAEWLPEFLGKYRLLFEAGFELNSSFSYYSGGLVIPLD